jgi:hypothetical protein
VNEEETQMENWKAYGQVIGYVDQLHRDIGQLVALTEQLVQEEGYEPLPSAGNRASYGVTSTYNNPGGWRVGYLSRFYIPADEVQYPYSVFYLVHLSAGSAFEFPPLICGRMEHDALSEKQIYYSVYNTEGIKSLAAKKPWWKAIRDEHGWTVAEPDYKTPAQRVRGYILNLFDMSDRQHVLDNVIKPLVSDEGEQLVLTVPKYRFGGLKESDLGL